MADLPRLHFLHGQKYVLYWFSNRPADVPTPAVGLGLPVTLDGAGNLKTTVDPEIPVLTVNPWSPPVSFPDRPGQSFLQVGLYNASAAVGDDGFRIKIAPPGSLTHIDRIHLLSTSEILWDTTAVCTPPILSVDRRTEHTPAEVTVSVTWTPAPGSAEVTADLLSRSFASCGHVVDMVNFGDGNEAIVKFTGPYSVVSILTGQSVSSFTLLDGQTISVTTVERTIGMAYEQRKGVLNLEFDADQRVNFLDIAGHFGSISPELENVELGEAARGEHPTTATVTFTSRDPVLEFLNGHASVVFYIGAKTLIAYAPN